MDLLTIFGLLVVSSILCWAGAEVVRRRSLTIRRVYLHGFHIAYGILLIAAMLIL